MHNISVLILTRNEQQDLPGCLKSFQWCDDVHVLDSLSDDQTVEIARQFGATVTSRAFDNWSSHQNWALTNIKFKHKWVYYSDADERVTPELVAAMAEFVENPGEHAAMRVRRRDYLNGTWLRHVTPSPFNIRSITLFFISSPKCGATSMPSRAIDVAKNCNASINSRSDDALILG